MLMMMIFHFLDDAHLYHDSICVVMMSQVDEDLLHKSHQPIQYNIL